MFDIAASELLIIAIVALIVIGPERLPRVARTLGHLFGRMQRYVNDVKADIQREVELDELRKLKQTVEDSARSIEASVSHEINAARDEVRSVETMMQEQVAQSSAALDPPPAAVPEAPALSGAAETVSPKPAETASAQAASAEPVVEANPVPAITNAATMQSSPTESRTG